MLCRGRSRCGGRASASRWLRQRRQRLLQVPTGLVKMSCGSAFALPAAGTASVSRKPVMCWMQLMWTWMSMQHRRSCGWCRAPLLRLAAATARAFPTLSSERLRQTLKSRISSRSSRSSSRSRCRWNSCFSLSCERVRSQSSHSCQKKHRQALTHRPTCHCKIASSSQSAQRTTVVLASRCLPRELRFRRADRARYGARMLRVGWASTDQAPIQWAQCQHSTAG
mmetsp:Transcript_37640/g.108001  ORF Transcript_37640/g.108001 Transcript_37640/m.108001 type:complete len:224 (-) Transcript_37640:404-1075(-)